MRSAWIVSTILCLVSLSFGINPEPYDQDLAILYLHFASAAYCDSTTISSWTCTPCSFLPTFQLVSTFANIQTNTFGFLGVLNATTAPEIVVAFRGTQSSNLENWITDLNIAHMTPYRNMTTAFVHEGFYKAFLTVSAIIFSNLENLISKYPQAPLTIVGHSLGGALATICTTECFYALKNRPPLVVYTYGCPRVGNNVYADMFDSVVQTSWRITHWRDIVPHLPPEFFGWLHSNQEVWYNEDCSSHTVCADDNEDPNCSDSVAMTAVSISDHLYYLNYSTGCSGSIDEYLLKL